MSLVPFQADHAHRIALTILYAHQLGYFVTLGDCYRDPRCPYGSPQSKHRLRLATDLNLFNEKLEYLTTTEDHEPLGVFWESIGGIWGGRFPRPDGGHYESPDS